MLASRRESKQPMFELSTSDALYIERQIKEYYKRLSAIQSVDTAVPVIALLAVVSFAFAWTGPLFVGFSGWVYKEFPRNGLEKEYQQQLEILIHLYSELLKTHGAQVTSNTQFLELMRIVQSCLPFDEANETLSKELLYPQTLSNSDSYAKLSDGYKKNLRSSQLGLDLIAPPPENPGFLASMFSSRPSEQPKPMEPPAKAEKSTQSSYSTLINSNYVWWKFYGRNQAMTNAKPAESVMEAVTKTSKDVVSAAMSMVVKRGS